MIYKAAMGLAEYFADRGVYEKSKTNIYRYGFELLLSTLINLLFVLIIAIITKAVVGAILFCMAFIPLRLSAGGYHANHHWTCILGFNTIFFGSVMLLRFIGIQYFMPYSVFTVLISSLLVMLYAPVEAVNKPLKAEQKEQQRKRSITIATVNLALVFIFYYAYVIDALLPLLAYYNSGAFAASLLLILAEKVNKRS